MKPVLSDHEFFAAFFTFGAWLLALCILAPLEMRGRYFPFFAAILSTVPEPGETPWITASSGRLR